MMLKIADEKEIATINVVKPDINTDQSEWRLGIETTAEILQFRIETLSRIPSLSTEYPIYELKHQKHIQL